MRRLAEVLRLLSGAQPASYAWTDPVMLSDDVVILRFRDRSVGVGKSLYDGAGIAPYVMNLVRPVVFTFLRDCAVVAHLRLSDVIQMRVSRQHRPSAELAVPLRDIVQQNGERLL
jgi:hypothetical protein